VAGVAAFTANLSPDGASIAFVDRDTVVVTDRDGQHRRAVLRGAAGEGFEPVWSPDSQRLLAVKGTAGGPVTYGAVTVASGSFTPLAHQPQEALHVLWSADGKHLGYATGTCRIATADADGGNARVVPVFGDLNSAANNQKRRSCDPYSISPDGRFVAVNQRTGDQSDGDIGRDLVANAVIDTRTGANVTLPVTDPVTAVVFQPNGDILVRTTSQLTLLNPDRTIKAQVAEPAAVKTFRLLAYTTN
jgi:TolB protein